MKNSKSSSIPMSSTCILELSNDSNNVDEINYLGNISSLLYLTANWPSILLYKCLRFQSALKQAHLTIVKHIIRYLIDTSSYELWYIKSNKINLKDFSDANYTGDKVNEKNTSDNCQFKKKSRLMEQQEIKLYFSIYYWIWIYWNRFVLCSNSLDVSLNQRSWFILQTCENILW